LKTRYAHSLKSEITDSVIWIIRIYFGIILQNFLIQIINNNKEFFIEEQNKLIIRINNIDDSCDLMIGGKKYYQKYLKYKQKYLYLKNKLNSS